MSKKRLIVMLGVFCGTIYVTTNFDRPLSTILTIIIIIIGAALAWTK